MRITHWSRAAANRGQRRPSVCPDRFFAELPTWKVADRDCGVIAAADQSYFAGFQVLARSLIGRVGLALFDLGIDADSRGWCRRHSIGVLTPPPLPVDGFHFWQSWNKPFYLAGSPFAVTLWIDCDCLAVGDLTPLFAMARRQPLVMAHPAGAKYVRPNPPALYELEPVVQRFEPHESINAGVLGFASTDAHRRLLDRWQWLVMQAARRESLRNLITWEDEGALHWSLQALALRDVVQWGRPEWNRHVSGKGQTLDEFLATISMHPNDRILHFSYRPKYWAPWAPLAA